MRETTPDEIGDLAEGITVWTSGYATNGDNMESNPIDPTAARVWQREAASRDERLAQEAHHQRYHGPGDYRVYLALKKPGKAARDRVQGMLVFDGFRDVIAVEKYGTSEIAATIYAPSDGAAEARVERALGGLHSMYDMVDVPEEDGLLIERLSEQYQYNGDNMESNATTPRLDADDWRKAAGLRSPSSTRGAVPLTEEQYEGAHSAGYEAASYLNSKGMHVGVDDAFVWASEHDRRVPRGISEDDPSFWEWVQGVADGAEAFKTGLPQERHFAVNADTFWVDATGRDGFQFLDRATVPLVSGTPLPLHSWSPLSPAQRNALERVRSEVLSEYLAAIEAEDEMGKEMRDAHRRPTADFSRGEYADLVETVRLLENAILSEIGY
jgi:hypothetical protein